MPQNELQTVEKERISKREKKRKRLAIPSSNRISKKHETWLEFMSWSMKWNVGGEGRKENNYINILNASKYMKMLQLAGTDKNIKKLSSDYASFFSVFVVLHFVVIFSNYICLHFQWNCTDEEEEKAGNKKILNFLMKKSFPLKTSSKLIFYAWPFKVFFIFLKNFKEKKFLDSIKRRINNWRSVKKPNQILSSVIEK